MKRAVRYQAAIVRGDYLLLLLVADAGSGRTFWLLPGGGREAGETEEACVLREVFEETTLRVAVEGLLFESPDIDGGHYQRQRTYLCRVIEGEARPGCEPEVDTDEHACIRATEWLDLRRPQGWDSLIRDNAFTFALLERVRAVLGYPSA